MIHSNFTQSIWFTPESELEKDKPVRFKLRTVPYKYLARNNVANVVSDASLLFVTGEEMLRDCVIDIDNIVTEVPKETILRDLISYLPSKIIESILQKLQELFIPSDKDMDELDTTVELMVDPRFADGSWNCKTCQERRLDRQRNCPLIEGTDHLDPAFTLPFLGETITTCPINKKNEGMAVALLEGYHIKEFNSLPENGALGEQPIFYVLGAQKLSDRVAYFKRKAEETKENNT